MFSDRVIVLSQKKLSILRLCYFVITIVIVLSVMSEMREYARHEPVLFAVEDVTFGNTEQLRDHLIEYFKKTGYPMAIA